MQVNLIFNLTDLFEECETIDNTKPIIEDIKNRISDSIDYINDYLIEFSYGYEKVTKILKENFEKFNIDNLTFDEYDTIINLLGECPNNNSEELVIQFDLQCNWDDADECLSDISKNDISEMSIRTWDDDYQVGNWYINDKRDDTDQEVEPLNTGDYKSNYAWVF